MTLDANGKAFVDVTLAADKTTEGAETMKLALSGGESASVAVTDSSTTPAFALTSGVDVIVGTAGADVINANDVDNNGASSLGAADSIDAGAGADVLNVTSIGNIAIPATLIVKGVETANITTQGSVGTSGAAADFSGWADTTALNIKSAGAYVKAAATTNVVDTNTSGNVVINGGLGVTVASTAGTVSVGGTTAPKGAVSVTAADAVTVTGGTSQAVTAANAVTVSGSTGAVSVTDTAQGANNISVDGGSTVAVTTTVAANAITAGTNGKVTIGNTVAATGAVTVVENLTNTAAANATANDKSGSAIAVRGGSTVSVTVNATQTVADAGNANSTLTQGNVSVTGTAAGTSTSATTSVTVAQTAAADVSGVSAAAVTESNTATFADLVAGQSVTIGGLTFTAGSAGATGAEIATAFASLAAGSTGGTTTKGTFSGTLTGWSTSAVSTGNTAQVTFTSSTAGSDVTDLAATVTGGATAPTLGTATQGAAAVGKGGIVAGTVTVTDAVGASSGAETTASSIATVTVSNAYAASTGDAVVIDSNALTSLSVAGVANGNVKILNANSRTTKTTALALSLDGVVTGSTNALSDEGVYKTATITTANNNSTLGNLNASALEDLTVGGAKLLTFTSTSGMSALKTVTVTGSAGISGTFAQPTLTSIDASATSGANTVTFNGTVATYKGGSGVDTVTSSTAFTSGSANKAISLGAGDDVLTLESNGGSGVFITGAIDGGTGVNTLKLTTADAVATSVDAGMALSVTSKVSNFQTLVVTALGTSAGTLKLDTLGFNGASNTVIVEGSTTNGAVTLDKFASGETVVDKVSAAHAITLSNSAWTATGATSDVVNLTLGNAAVSAVASTLNSSGVETLNVNTGTATGSTNLTVADTSTTKIVLTGTAAIALHAASDTALVTVDGSGLTGALTVANNDLGKAGAVTVTGGAGADNLAAHIVSGVSYADTLVGGAGNDTLTANAAADTLTGGAGYDTFVVATATSNAGVYSTVTDFAKGDILQLKDQGTEVFNATKLSLAATASFADYLAAASTADGSSNGQISWFQYNGDTYVVEDNSLAGTYAAATDIVVKLSGLLDLSNSHLVGASTNQLLFG